MQGQAIRIVKFVPGNYLANNLHEVDLYNAGNQTVNLGNYYLVTRDYTLKFPDGTRLFPGATYRIGKSKQGKPNLNLELSRAPDFFIRFYEKKAEGNFVAVLDANLQPVAAFYHSQRPDPPFLPDSGHFVLSSRRMVAYRLPGPASRLWQYFPLGEDPAVGFEQVQGSWRVTSATQDINLYPTTEFIDFKARYHDEVVTLKWNTSFEERLDEIEVQRSTNGSDFITLARIKAKYGTRQQVTGYSYPDSRLNKNDSLYYYRLAHLDAAGHVIESKVVQVLAREVPQPFWLEVYPARTNMVTEVGIRFSSAYSQEVNMLLLDSQGKLVQLLFHGPVYAEVQNLLELKSTLSPGLYYIVATTEEDRHFQRLEIFSP